MSINRTEEMVEMAKHRRDDKDYEAPQPVEIDDVTKHGWKSDDWSQINYPED